MRASFSEDENLDDEDDEPLRATSGKRRQGQKKRPLKKISNELDEDDADATTKGKMTKAETRLNYYTGRTLSILKRTIIFMRLYLLTCNGFPSGTKLHKNAKKFYKASCQLLLGSTWKGMF